MVIHPEVQRKAQEEIDRVIGGSRLPTLADQPNLPYVDALVKEVFRWQQVGPLGELDVVYFLSEVTGWCSPFVTAEADRCWAIPGIPHVATEDDAYKGYFIPKGIVVIANIW